MSGGEGRDGTVVSQVNTSRGVRERAPCQREPLSSSSVASTGLGTQQGPYLVCQITTVWNILRDLVVTPGSPLASPFPSLASVSRSAKWDFEG